MLEVEIAVAKTHKYASRESGDTVEIAERPTGGISVVTVDGQGSGNAAKSLSMLVSSKAVSLIKEGIRDGAVARGTHDYLHAYRHGKVSATLDLVSVDLASSTVVVTRNSHIPYLVGRDSVFKSFNEVAGPIGLYRHSRPVIDQFDAGAGLQIIIFTDGISGAGKYTNTPFDPLAYLHDHARVSTTAQAISDGMLMAAMASDSGRPRDDMSVVTLSIDPREQTADSIRRMHVRIPISG